MERGEDLVGEVEGEYTVEEGRVKIPLDFKRDESKIIALSTDADRFGAAQPRFMLWRPKPMPVSSTTRTA